MEDKYAYHSPECTLDDGEDDICPLCDHAHELIIFIRTWADIIQGTDSFDELEPWAKVFVTESQQIILKSTTPKES